MKLRSLEIERLAGLTRPIQCDFDPHVTVVHGPNASGKSSLVRALAHLLFDLDWSRSPARDTHFVGRAEFRVGSSDAETWLVTQDGSQERGRDGSGAARWSSVEASGALRGRPQLPSSAYASCFLIALREIFASSSESSGAERDAAIAEIRRQLGGGQDFASLQELFRARPRAGHAEAAAMRDARRAYDKVRERHALLASRESTLAALEREVEAERGARRRVAAIDLALELHACRAELEEHRARVEASSPLVRALDGSEGQRLQDLERASNEALAGVEEASARLRALEFEIEDLRVYACLDSAMRESLRRSMRRVSHAQAELRTLRAELEFERRHLAQDFGRDLPAPLAPADHARLERYFADAHEIELRRRALLAREKALDEDQSGHQVDVLVPIWASLLRVSLVGGAGLALTAAVASVLHDLWYVSLAIAGACLMLVSLAFARRARRESARVLTRTHRRKRAILAKKRAGVERLALRIASRKEALERLLGYKLTTATSALDVARARAKHEGARARSEELERRYAILQAESDEEYSVLSAQLARVGVESLADWAADEVALESSLSAAERYDELRGRLDEARTSLTLARRRSARAESAVEDHLASMGLARGDEKELLEACARVADFRAHGDAMRAQEARQAALEARLAEASEGLEDAFASYSTADLSERRDLAERAIDRRADVQRQLGALEADVARVCAGDELARTRLALQAARERLDTRFDEALDGVAAELLLERVAVRTREECRPAVVREAGRLFSSFTKGEWELRIASAGDGAAGRALAPIEVAAYDCRRAVFASLDQLSDGTRVQLLLAVRLAVAFACEGAEAMPIVFDEALAHSDDDRFAAIVECLLLLAHREDRQFVILTADEADLVRIARVAERLSVAPPVVQRLGATAAEALEIPRPTSRREQIEGWESWDVETWTRRTGVTAIDVRAAEDTLHLYWLLADDRASCARLYVARIDTLGHWRALQRRGAGHVLSAELVERLALRIELWLAWRAAWRIGRGGLLEAAQVTQLASVGPSFRDAVRKLCVELRGDARALLAAIEGGAVPRFRRKAAESLRVELRESGYLDEREELSPSERRACALAVLDGELSSDELAAGVACIDIFEASLEPGDPAPAVRQSAAWAAARRAPGMR